jgi:hypothetical protein
MVGTLPEGRKQVTRRKVKALQIPRTSPDSNCFDSRESLM